MRTSESFVCRLDTQSVTDMEKLQEIRNSVAATNRILKYRSDVRLRVEVRGRKPLVKMPIGNCFYKRSSGKPVAYDWGGNIVGGIANAAKLDVYIYYR